MQYIRTLTDLLAPSYNVYVHLFLYLLASICIFSGPLYGKVTVTNAVTMTGTSGYLSPVSGCKFDFDIGTDSSGTLLIHLLYTAMANTTRDGGVCYLYMPVYPLTGSSPGWAKPAGGAGVNTISYAVAASGAVNEANFGRGNNLTNLTTTVERYFEANACAIKTFNTATPPSTGCMILKSSTANTSVYSFSGTSLTLTAGGTLSDTDFDFGGFTYSSKSWTFGQHGLFLSGSGRIGCALTQCFYNGTPYWGTPVFMYTNASRVYEGTTATPKTNVSSSETTTLPWSLLSTVSGTSTGWFWMSNKMQVHYTGFFTHDHAIPYTEVKLSPLEPYASSLNTKHVRATATHYDTTAGATEADWFPTRSRVYIQHYATAGSPMAMYKSTYVQMPTTTVAGDKNRIRITVDVAADGYSGGSYTVVGTAEDGGLWLFYTDSAGKTYTYCLEDITGSASATTLVQWYHVSIAVDKWGKPYILASDLDTGNNSIARLYYFSGHSYAYSSSTNTPFMADVTGTTPICRSVLCKYDIAQTLRLTYYGYYLTETEFRASPALVRYNGIVDPHYLHIMYLNTGGALYYIRTPLPPSF